MSLRYQLKQLLSGSFVRDVAKLSLGTLAGRVITVAALPLLTRLYSPEDFALLATYVALVSTISVAACLRFEIAIPLAENDEDAKNLLMLALTALTAVTLVALLLVWWLPEQLTAWIKQPDMLRYLWLIPLGIATLGIYSVTQFWATRARRFTQIAQTGIIQAFTGVATSLALGWAGFVPLGLLLGNMLNSSAGGLRLAFWSLKHEAEKLKGMNRLDLRRTLHKYRRYPIYSTPESLFNTAGIQVPILLVAAYAGAEAGFLMLATQIMAAPMGLLGGAISQVYVARAPQALQEGQLAGFTRSIMLRLFRVGFVPFLLLGGLAPLWVPSLFGPNWERTGEIISWMVPWMLLQFIVSSVSMALHVTGHQVQAMILQAFGMVLRISSVLIAAYAMPQSIVEAYAVSGAVFYAVFLLTVNKVIHAR